MSGMKQARLPTVRVTAAAALTSAVFFVVCWIGALVPIGPASHRYISLFTLADPGSAASLVQGTAWSAMFGLIGGWLFAVLFNALGGLDRR